MGITFTSGFFSPKLSISSPITSSRVFPLFSRVFISRKAPNNDEGPISETNVPTPPFQTNTVHVENLDLKEQLARLLGTTPETLSRILKQTADKGLIEIKRRDINILNYKELAEHGKTII
ncbi:MAG: helix-turn-helix domain-containing protein [Thermodesulfobacteriota bacterium]|nr:helix-turn-helix domain-containing protein [Thermodesulfobacteriota bacterium]